MYYGHVANLRHVFGSIVPRNNGYTVEVVMYGCTGIKSRVVTFTEGKKLVNALTVKPEYNKDFVDCVLKYGLQGNSFVNLVMGYK